MECVNYLSSSTSIFHVSYITLDTDSVVRWLLDNDSGC